MTTKSEGMMIPGKLKWYVILALALWLAFSGVAAAEQLYVNESGWWREGGVFNASTAPIQAAVDNTTAGDSIFVHGGNYYENVDVDNPRLTLEGEVADVVTVTAADSGDHVFDVIADYVNISGFAVRGATDSGMAGAYLGNANYCNISGNDVYGNYNGIYLGSSSDNTLTNNNANSNNGIGIGMKSSSNYNTLTNNTVSKNGVGIYLDHSSNYNTLVNNTASNNMDGIYIEDSNSNTLANNIVSNNPYGISMERSSNNTLTNNTVKSGIGIILREADYNNIARNWVQNNTWGGFRLYNADNNNITCNWVQNNLRGFRIDSGSTGNNISYNNIIENGNYNTETGGWEWQFDIEQYQPVEAKHNYWGAGMNNSTIDASIYDDEEGGWGAVEFYPFETEPVPCAPAPAPEKPPAFTTTDAMIALQIAVGSRPFDPRWDVSGDNVTSLDALMILQAAAGGIEIG